MQKHKQRQWQFTVLYVIAAAILFYFIQRGAQSAQPKSISYTEFVSEARAGHLAEVAIGADELTGKLTDDAAASEGVKSVTAARLPNIADSSLLQDLETNHVNIIGRAETQSWWGALLLSWLLPMLIIGGIWAYGLYKVRSASSGPLTFGKNRAKIYDQSSANKLTFRDVAGADEAKAELFEVVDFLQNPQKYQRLGGRIPKGVLLVGAPGTGKTLLARAVAGESRVPFFSISGSEFVEMFVGVGAARVRDLFEQAKQKAPCIIFIDELDAVGKSRASSRGAFVGNDEREQTLNQLLVEMDGFDASKGLIIMGATNTPEVLDPALLRPGRFDRQVVIDKPDLAGREEILRLHAQNVKLAPDVDLKAIAARTPGMVGADLANVINEGALLAARRDAESVEMRDLEEAIDRVTLGLEKKKRVMTPEEKERVAYHEAGHTLVAFSVEHADPVYRVSIISRGVGSLGHTLQLPTQEKYLLTRPELEDRIAVMLGGRVAEEIVYDGVISTGASDDLERASELIRQMVTRFGMSDRMGNLTYGRPAGARFLTSPFEGEDRNYSEETARAIDQETRRIMDQIHERVREILRKRVEELRDITAILIKKETLDREELDSLLKKRPAAAD
jgi:cell division protease FtsH